MYIKKQQTNYLVRLVVSISFKQHSPNTPPTFAVQDTRSTQTNCTDVNHFSLLNKKNKNSRLLHLQLLLRSLHLETAGRQQTWGTLNELWCRHLLKTSESRHQRSPLCYCTRIFSSLRYHQWELAMTLELSNPVNHNI